MSFRGVGESTTVPATTPDGGWYLSFVIGLFLGFGMLMTRPATTPLGLRLGGNESSQSLHF
jgi:hypothetical protein